MSVKVGLFIADILNSPSFVPSFEIRASSLSSVMCDNGDGLERAARDAFRVDSGGEEEYVACEDIPRMALQPWFGACFCVTVQENDTATSFEGFVKSFSIK